MIIFNSLRGYYVKDKLFCNLGILFFQNKLLSTSYGPETVEALRTQH